MSWIAVAVGGTTALGYIQGNEKERAQRKMNNANAEANRYSPWTGRSFAMDHSADGAALGGALQGATTGLMLGQSLKKPTPGATQLAGIDPTSTQAVTGTGNPATNMWTSDMMKQGVKRSAFGG